MRHFGIYQFFVDAREQKRNLLVGFASAKSSDAAIESFTDDEFRQDYLKAVECNEADTQSSILKAAIERNIKELGVWAKSPNENSGLHKHIVSNHVKNACCNTCVKCELYENENTVPSDKYFCKVTEEMINDIEHPCMDYEPE